MMHGRLQRVCRAVALPLAAVMLAGGFRTGVSHAVMISTDQALDEMAADTNRDQVRDFLARADVRRQMEALGVDAREATVRVAALSDAEVQRIVDRLDAMPAGQSTAGAIVGAVVLVFVILLITDIIGWTDVYPFVR